MSKIFNIEKTHEEKRDVVLTNVVKMLAQRGYMTNAASSIEQIIDNITKPNNFEHDDAKYSVPLGNYEGNATIKQMSIKIIPYKITSIGKMYGITDFLNMDRDVPKMLIVASVNKKVQTSIKNYKNVEIFEEEFLMINLMEHVAVPPHIKLSEEDKQKVLTEYIVKKKDMPKIRIDDPVSIYFNAKLGDMFRIVRPSYRTGITHAYRLVVSAPFK
jgi:DNA-directed RNA polymerase subunit H (RpoH/RPB5)